MKDLDHNNQLNESNKLYDLDDEEPNNSHQRISGSILDDHKHIYQVKTEDEGDDRQFTNEAGKG